MNFSSSSDVLNYDEGMSTIYILWLNLGLVTIILNLIAAFALYKSDTINMQIRIFSIQLTFIETLFGVYIIMNQIFKPSNIHMPCRFRWYTHWGICLTRALTVAFLSLDRFLCIYFAMKYVQYVSKRLVLAVCLFAWIFPLIVCTQMFIGVPDTEQTYCEDVQKMKSIEGGLVTFLVCIVIVISAYVGIFINVKLHEREMHILAHKSTMKVLAIVLGFLFTFLPLLIYNIYIWILPEMFYGTSTLRRVCNVFVFIGSIATPFLYVLRFKECRIQLTKACCCLCKSRQEESERQLKFIVAPYLRDRGTPNNSVVPMDA